MMWEIPRLSGLQKMLKLGDCYQSVLWRDSQNMAGESFVSTEENKHEWKGTRLGD